MVKNTVTPATISLFGVTPSAFRPNSLSSMRSPTLPTNDPSPQTKRPERGSGLDPPLRKFSPNLAVLARSRSFMGWLDIVLRGASHEISGYIAVHNTQFNFVQGETKAVLVTLLLLTALPAAAGSVTGPPTPDPLLDGGPTASCAAGADYAA